MDLNGSQALNLSSKNSSMQQQRNNNSNNGNNDRSKFNKNQQQQSQHNFDVLSPFGGDINAAVAALAHASGAGNQNDVAALASVAANFSALAKLNPQNLAAILQLQQHQHLMNPSSSLAPPPPPPVHQTSMSQMNMGGGIPNIGNNNISSGSIGGGNNNNNSNNKPNYTRYQQLLSVIDEMGKDLRTTYLGNKNSAERLKRGIASARVLVKDCQMECDRNTKQ